MSPLTIGFAGLAVMIVLLLARLPVGVTLGVVAIAGVWLLVGERAALGLLNEIPYEFVAHWTLSSVPMFLLMGYVSFRAGLTEGLFRAARLWLGGLPGGLAITTIGGAAAFSAVTGSSVACAAAMGRIALPEMLRYRYDPALASGAVAAAGTLGSLIPPSIILLIYGVFAEVPISRLFVAGILPGLLTAVLYAAMVVVRVRITPALAPSAREPATARQKLAALGETWPVILMIVGVFGGLFGGLFTPTEAGAVGALLALVIAAAKRTLSFESFRQAVSETLHSTAAIFIIAIGAQLLTRFLALSGVPEYLAEAVAVEGGGEIALVLGFSLAYLALGMFLDPIGIMLLTLPIILPVAEAVHMDLIWLGILLTKYLEIALITPPVGLNVFVVRAAAPDIATTTIFRGIAWFVATDLVTVALLIAFPAISLALPRLLG
ncbi:MAG TPA: TRAP transporter large permease subunit [Alphaproteobacteria bacterium]